MIASIGTARRDSNAVISEMVEAKVNKTIMSTCAKATFCTIVVAPIAMEAPPNHEDAEIHVM